MKKIYATAFISEVMMFCKSQCLKGNHGTYGVIGQSAELTSEAAKATLEKMKGREKDG